MTGSDPYIGQVLDEKYRLERLLGRGGMGAVYLASHLGTERYVALKLITPHLMRNEEFVARFKREARAAGRLRHPNVVDVTDFGFAHAGSETVAYLVMEYLDGCTLADVLAEEKRLPLDWVVDILEQVCSAVHEAHQQGIVHRDLKPENIWLEPNRLGGYRIKVLDFGIAKLAESGGEGEATAAAPVPTATGDHATRNAPGGAATAVKSGHTTAQPGDARQASERATLIFSGADKQRAHARPEPANATQPDRPDEAVRTELFTRPEAKPAAADTIAEPVPSGDEDGTLLFGNETKQLIDEQQTRRGSDSTSSAELTRVGAIMGTPVYMSPEQCAGKVLDARSDIYSLGVIAYQMLAGGPPFAGTTGNVMQEHMHVAPLSLRERNKKVPKRVAQVVMRALAKLPAERPPTAAAFASALRAQADGIGSLYRRAFSLYSEYFPKFFKLSLIAHLPVFVITLFLIAFELGAATQPNGHGVVRVLLLAGVGIFQLLQVAAYFLAATAISGLTAVIVTQLTLAPLRPVDLRAAFALLKRRRRPFLSTAIRVALRIFFGFILCLIPGIVMSIRYAMYAPVVLMEGLEKKAAMRRARALAARSWRTIIIVSLLQWLIPIVISAIVGRFGMVQKTETGIHLTDRSMGAQIYQQLSGLVNVFVVPLVSIVPALLYLKMRQLGGEPLIDTLAVIEDPDARQSVWQQRMRTRLSLHPSRPSKEQSQAD